jgi:hypothetical protein
MKTRNLKTLILIILTLTIYSCSKDNDTPQPATNEVIEAFRLETGIGAVYILDTSILNSVKSWQGHGDYPGVDDWATAKVPHDFDLYGGLPGQSEYYTIDQTIIETDTMQVKYWESLQVKENPTYGYRPMVGVFDIQDSIMVAISKTLANPQYGDGGGWQLYVEGYKTELTVLDTIYLKK